jgi:hypothetical protein
LFHVQLVSSNIHGINEEGLVHAAPLRPMISSGGKSAQLAFPLRTEAELVHWASLLKQRGYVACGGTDSKWHDYFAFVRISDGDTFTPIPPEAIISEDGASIRRNSPCKATHSPGGDLLEETAIQGCIMAISFLSGGECHGFVMGGVEGVKAAMATNIPARWVTGALCEANPCTVLCLHELRRELLSDVRLQMLVGVANKQLVVPGDGVLSLYINQFHPTDWAVAGAIDENWVINDLVQSCDAEPTYKFSFAFFHTFFDILGLGDGRRQAMNLQPRWGRDKSLPKNSWVTGKAATLGFFKQCAFEPANHPVGHGQKPDCSVDMSGRLVLEELDHELARLF